MNILGKTISMVMLLVMFNSQAADLEAAQVSVEWVEPENFTDILAGDQLKSRYQQQLFKGFEKYFNKLARRLPTDYQWHIKVTDIDLAGDVNHGYSAGLRRIRVLGSFFKIKVAFSYQVMNAQGAVVVQGDEVLKENMIEKFPRTVMRLGSHSYEQYLVKRWFDKVLLAKLNDATAL
jgi:hypothetical protein